MVAHSPRHDPADEDDGQLGLGENGTELAVADGCHCRDGGLRHEQEEGGADPQPGRGVRVLQVFRRCTGKQAAGAAPPGRYHISTRS